MCVCERARACVCVVCVCVYVCIYIHICIHIHIHIQIQGSYMENDKWCTLGEVSERLFSTAIESTWRYATPNADFNACYDKVNFFIIFICLLMSSFTNESSLYLILLLMFCISFSQIFILPST